MSESIKEAWDDAEMERWALERRQEWLDAPVAIKICGINERVFLNSLNRIRTGLSAFEEKIPSCNKGYYYQQILIVRDAADTSRRLHSYYSLPSTHDSGADLGTRLQKDRAVAVSDISHCKWEDVILAATAAFAPGTDERKDLDIVIDGLAQSGLNLKALVDLPLPEDYQYISEALTDEDEHGFYAVDKNTMYRNGTEPS